MSASAIKWLVITAVIIVSMAAVAIWGTSESFSEYRDWVLAVLAVLGLGGAAKGAAAPASGKRRPGDDGSLWVVFGITMMTIPIFVSLMLVGGCATQRCPDGDNVAITVRKSGAESRAQFRCTPTDPLEGEPRLEGIGTGGHTLRVQCPPGEMVVGKTEYEVKCRGRQRCPVQVVVCGPAPTEVP